MSYEGGCLCGSLRYRSVEDPVDTGYCHCRLCQRSTGAPVLAYAAFPVDAFTYTAGQPALYASSTHGHREFCARCGTQIAYRQSKGARTVDVNVGSLDDPKTAPPRRHIWCRSAIDWLGIRDDLPRFEQSAEQSDPPG